MLKFGTADPILTLLKRDLELGKENRFYNAPKNVFKYYSLFEKEI